MSETSIPGLHTWGGGFFINCEAIMKNLKLFDLPGNEKQIILNGVKFHKTQGGLIFLVVQGNNKANLDDLVNLPPVTLVMNFRG